MSDENKIIGLGETNAKDLMEGSRVLSELNLKRLQAFDSFSLAKGYYEYKRIEEVNTINTLNNSPINMRKEDHEFTPLPSEIASVEEILEMAEKIYTYFSEKTKI